MGKEGSVTPLLLNWPDEQMGTLSSHLFPSLQSSRDPAMQCDGVWDGSDITYPLVDMKVHLRRDAILRFFSPFDE